MLGAELPDDAAAHADAALAADREGARANSRRATSSRSTKTSKLPLAPVLAKMESGRRRDRPRGAARDRRRGRRATPRDCSSKSTISPAKSSTSARRSSSARCSSASSRFPGGKKTKTGWATGVEVLQGLAREYPICALVLEWREVTKLKNTYVDVIPQLVDPRDGRLRTEFNQTATATGRLSSTNPNLQNIPVRGELGRRIRRAFVARNDDYVLLAADYSQIELRLMAHLSGDDAMRAAFEEAQDIHDFTARQIFSVASGERSRPEPAPHGQERELRAVLRHVGLRSGAAPGDRPRRGQGDHHRLLRALSGRARVHRAHDRRGAPHGLRLDDSRAPALHARPHVRKLHAARGRRARGDQRAAARQRRRSHEARDGAHRSRARRVRARRHDAAADPRRADLRGAQARSWRTRRASCASTWSARSSYRFRWK